MSSRQSTNLFRAKQSFEASGNVQEASGSMCRYSHSHPYGQHPRAKKRQQQRIPVLLPRVNPESRLILHRVCDFTLLYVYQHLQLNFAVYTTYLEQLSSLSPPAHLLYHISIPSVSSSHNTTNFSTRTIFFARLRCFFLLNVSRFHLLSSRFELFDGFERCQWFNDR